MIENVTNGILSKRIVKTYRGIMFGSYGRVLFYHAILDSRFGLRGTEMTDYRVTGRKSFYQKLKNLSLFRKLSFLVYFCSKS